MKAQQLKQRMTRIQEELAALGPMHPGSLSQQYNVCGNPTCRCKDPKKPKKHGPYYQLSYTWRGKSTTRFVKRAQLPSMREKLANYKRFRGLTEEWVDVAVALEAAEREAAKTSR